MNDPLILPIDGPAVMDHSLRVIAPYFRSHSAPPCSKVLLAVVALDDNARRALVCRAQDTLGPHVAVATHLLDARDPLTSFLDLLRQTRGTSQEKNGTCHVLGRQPGSGA